MENHLIDFIDSRDQAFRTVEKGIRCVRNYSARGHSRRFRGKTWRKNQENRRARRYFKALTRGRRAPFAPMTTWDF